MRKIFCYLKNSTPERLSAILLKTALLVVTVLCLSLSSCAPKEVIRRALPAPYEGVVTVGALQQSVGFGDVRSIKALADVTVYKQGSNEGSMNGVVGYKAPRKMRVDLFGPFGLTVTEILISGDLLQISIPQKNILYEWKAPEVSFTGLMKGGFRYEKGEEGDMHVLFAYLADGHNSELAAKYYFDRTYLLNRAISLYKDGSEVITAEFDDFNGRVPERIKITLSSGLAINIALQESEFDTDIPDEYFKTIEHGDKQIKPFEELLKTPFDKPDRP
jgi:outer membrane lipoprotein-sorting protein